MKSTASIHYCVANMPGGVPHTSTYALNNATLPFTLALATKGARQALLDDPHLLDGLNVCAGKITNQAVADAMGYEFVQSQIVPASGPVSIIQRCTVPRNGSTRSNSVTASMRVNVRCFSSVDCISPR